MSLPILYAPSPESAVFTPDAPALGQGETTRDYLVAKELIGRVNFAGLNPDEVQRALRQASDELAVVPSYGPDVHIDTEVGIVLEVEREEENAARRASQARYVDFWSAPQSARDAAELSVRADRLRREANVARVLPDVLRLEGRGRFAIKHAQSESALLDRASEHVSRQARLKDRERVREEAARERAARRVVRVDLDAISAEEAAHKAWWEAARADDLLMALDRPNLPPQLYGLLCQTREDAERTHRESQGASQLRDVKADNPVRHESPRVLRRIQVRAFGMVLLEFGGLKYRKHGPSESLDKLRAQLSNEHDKQWAEYGARGTQLPGYADEFFAMHQA